MRVDACDYSVDPRMIGRFVDVTATLESVSPRFVTARSSPAIRAAGAARPPDRPDARRHHEGDAPCVGRRPPGRAATRRYADGHRVALRALPDYDALFGVDFDPTGTESQP
ncbi:hypothetical protein ThrDRAFT_03484 [Frankia casuarinae]|uniref:Transposase for insertion sequence element IS21-like C-terminal domain-containing protein n=1 Tax=Frankia casuarinae (strain DSM 45818 / CECT 9043 / HFP020203 / CcI3) TaxID=106370 RepID=Q2JC58_FRACC|nr:hypothetical protein Francci3_1758 [Frankia casuarinae]EYT90904.1 hypothetical protein ThrDRAFT_03484 [Frankia casuarinae]